MEIILSAKPGEIWEETWTNPRDGKDTVKTVYLIKEFHGELWAHIFSQGKWKRIYTVKYLHGEGASNHKKITQSTLFPLEEYEI